ncbi:hypothetical protein DCAR_0207530 [Daucus carota subsp. sativus]|uniref:Uncharacterized protein n=1 Tax=Daucus carota subsp. sativus TaxID=79200 RepID=A0A166DYT6_DAUCS|nr:hypothetical protein DCAR_0207530 [Daucus carota subsp. sativus]
MGNIFTANKLCAYYLFHCHSALIDYFSITLHSSNIEFCITNAVPTAFLSFFEAGSYSWHNGIRSLSYQSGKNLDPNRYNQ